MIGWIKRIKMHQCIQNDNHEWIAGYIIRSKKSYLIQWQEQSKTKEKRFSREGMQERKFKKWGSEMG